MLGEVSSFFLALFAKNPHLNLEVEFACDATLLHTCSQQAKTEEFCPQCLCGSISPRAPVRVHCAEYLSLLEATVSLSPRIVVFLGDLRSDGSVHSWTPAWGGGGRGQGVKVPGCPEWGTGRREASYVVGPRAVGVCLG